MLAIGNAVLAMHPYATIAGHRFLLFDVAGLAAMIAMSVMALATIARHTAVLYRREPLR